MRRTLVLVAALCFAAFQVADRAYVSNGHVWGTSSVTYKVNPTNIFSLSSSDVITAVQNGLAPWGTAGASFAYAYGGTTSSTTMANDGSNNIFFRNDTNGGYIAETWWYYDGTGHLVDFDIVFHEALVAMFPTAATCSNGISIQETALHEAGHGLGLGHSADSSAIMYASVGYCDPRTTLAADDIAAVNFLYPPSGGSTGGGGTTDPPPTPVSVPGLPSAPSPRNGSNAARNTNLSWTAGTGATSHDVYFGACTANPPLYAINLTSASLTLPRLDALTRYCWRVVEKNTQGETAGPLWGFTTRKN